MLLMILSSICMGVGIGLAVTNFMDIIDRKRKGSVLLLVIGILVLILGISGFYVSNVI